MARRKYTIREVSDSKLLEQLRAVVADDARLIVEEIGRRMHELRLHDVAWHYEMPTPPPPMSMRPRG